MNAPPRALLIRAVCTVSRVDDTVRLHHLLHCVRLTMSLHGASHSLAFTVSNYVCICTRYRTVLHTAVCLLHVIFTLHAKFSGTVYCNRSCLWVCLCECVCVYVTTITRNFVHRSLPNWVCG